MEQRLPSPSTPPVGPADVGRDATKAAINQNLETAGGVSGQAVGVATPAATADTQVAQTKPGVWGAVMETFNKFSDDDVMTQAAALAYYTGIAMAPLLTVAVWIATLVLSNQATDRVTQVAEQIVGQKAAAPIRDLLKPASQQAQSSMTITGIVSIVVLAFTASSVLAQLQASLNLIWHVKADPKKSGILIMIRKRVFSFGMLFTLLFLLLVSMMVTVGVEAVIGRLFGTEIKMIAMAVNLVGTLIVATGVFMLVYSYLPDARVPWRDTLFGAALTAVLFIVGRYGLAIYIGHSNYETAYTAAVGSFLALLVWVYYTSIIIFIGTEATTVWSRRHGHDPKPEKHAVRMLRTERILESHTPAARVAEA